MRKFIYLILTLTSITNTQLLYAQELNKLQVNLQDLFNLADSNSRSLQISIYQQETAAENLKQQKNRMLPSVDVSLSFTNYGTGWVTDRNFSNTVSAEIPHFGDNFAFNATEIIYAGGVLKTSVKVAQLGLLIAKLEKEKNKQDIRFLIAGYYLELQKIENQTSILQHNLQQTNVLLNQIQHKFRQGTALKNAVTRYELQKQSLDLSLLKLENGRQIINNELVNTLLLTKGTILVIKKSSNALLDSVSSEEWQKIATQNAPAFKQMVNRVKSASHMVALAKSDRLPQIFAFASHNIGGPILVEVPPLNKNLIYWSAGVGIKYNIASIYQSGSKIKTAKIAEKIAIENNALVKEQLSNDIQSATILYQEAKDVYHTQLKSVQLANENYNVVRNRYLADLVLITEMLDAENSKIEAEMQAANAQINILFRFYQLNKISGTL